MILSDSFGLAVYYGDYDNHALHHHTHRFVDGARRYCFSADKGQTNTLSCSWANDPVPVSTIVNFGSFMPLDLISDLSLCKVAIPSLIRSVIFLTFIR